MVVFWGLPGTRQFHYGWFATRKECEEYIDNRLGEEPTQEELSAKRQSTILSDREASRARWQDGKRIWDGSKMSPVEIERLNR